MIAQLNDKRPNDCRPIRARLRRHWLFKTANSTLVVFAGPEHINLEIHTAELLETSRNSLERILSERLLSVENRSARISEINTLLDSSPRLSIAKQIRLWIFSMRRLRPDDLAASTSYGL